MGLKNQGNTCYLNAVMQQLFSFRPLRRAILSPGALLAGQTSPLPSTESKSASKEESKGETKHGGGDPSSSSKNGSAVASSGGDDNNNGEKELDAAARRLLGAVQRTFTFLERSLDRAHDPLQLVEACRTLRLGNDVYLQNDAEDFANKLVDRLEAALMPLPPPQQQQQQQQQQQPSDEAKSGGETKQGKETKGQEGEADAGAAVRNLLQENVFGGELVHITDRTAGGCPHVTERREPFVCFPIEVKGHSRVETALQASVEAELMTGDNRVECEDCSAAQGGAPQKFDAKKRTCLDEARLPPLLVLHLKRFKLNYETFAVEKINDRMEFSNELDLAPFTKAGIAYREQEEEAAAAATAAAAAGGGGDLRAAAAPGAGGGGSSPSGSPVGSPARGLPPGATAAAPSPARSVGGGDAAGPTAAFAGGSGAEAPPKALYRLRGVVVHAGVAQGGHYYSFIRQDSGSSDASAGAASTASNSSAGANSDGALAAAGGEQSATSAVPNQESAAAESKGGGSSGGGSKAAPPEVWYKFDDDRVSPFDPAAIPAACFGEQQPVSSSLSSSSLSPSATSSMSPGSSSAAAGDYGVCMLQASSGSSNDNMIVSKIC